MSNAHSRQTNTLKRAYPEGQEIQLRTLTFRLLLDGVAGGRPVAVLWRHSLLEYDEMEGIAWQWQSLDGALVKVPMALELVGRNPTDRVKKRQQVQRSDR